MHSSIAVVCSLFVLMAAAWQGEAETEPIRVEPNRRLDVAFARARINQPAELGTPQYV
jgi:hypothetical protein